MAWWGKIIGGAIGLGIAGPVGGLLGLAIGSAFDRNGQEKIESQRKQDFQKIQENLRNQKYRRNQENQRNQENKKSYTKEKIDAQERTQVIFFIATFSIMGHVAKADGRISTEEIKMASSAFDSFNLNKEQLASARRLFNEGKQPGFAVWEVLEQFRVECRGKRSLYRAFINIQIKLALSDGELHAQELSLLKRMAQVLGFSTGAFDSMLEMGVKASGYAFHRQKEKSYSSNTDPITAAYNVLDARPEQTDAEVKNAYRRMMNQYHPDKLVARGLPQEMVLAATEKAKEIQNAWALIKKERAKS